MGNLYMDSKDSRFASGSCRFASPDDSKRWIPGMASSVGASSPTEADIAAREPDEMWAGRC